MYIYIYADLYTFILTYLQILQCLLIIWLNYNGYFSFCAALIVQLIKCTGNLLRFF